MPHAKIDKKQKEVCKFEKKEEKEVYDCFG